MRDTAYRRSLRRLPAAIGAINKRMPRTDIYDMCYTPTRYELLWVDEVGIGIDLHAFNNECSDTFCIRIRYDDFFNWDKCELSEYADAKAAYRDFCEYIKECMEPYDDCPDADFEKVRGYKTVYKKACAACKAFITDMWTERRNAQDEADIEADEKEIADPEFEQFKRRILNHLDTLSREPCDTGRFTDYSAWADALHDKVLDFYEERGIYPNILLTNDATYDKITEYEQDKPENRVWEGDGEPEEFTGLASFTTPDYALEFCVDNEMEADMFRLVYDEDPTFDGEEIPEDSTETYVKKTA